MELRLAWQMTRYSGSLPDVGGLLDQRAKLMRAIDMARNVYYGILSESAAPAGNKGKWRSENPTLADAVDLVEKLRRV